MDVLRPFAGLVCTVSLTPFPFVWRAAKNDRSSYMPERHSAKDLHIEAMKVSMPLAVPFAGFEE